MPTPAIVKGSDHFFNVLYEGNGSGQRIGKFIPFTDDATIAKSLIFNDGSNPNLTRTAGGSPSSTKIFTLSWWVKRCTLSTTQTMIGLAEVTGSTNRPVMNFDSSNRLQVVTSGGTTMNKISTRGFFDTSKWYHFVVRVDTTQSTAADRVRIYVDGDQITSFSTNTIPSQNAAFQLVTQQMNIGRLSGTSQQFDGYLAEINYADGQSYAPTQFGMTDTSSGRWVPTTVSVTYGNNGYRLQFANSAGQTVGDDTSGNTNDFTVNNLDAADATTDSPTQNHSIMDSNITAGSISLNEGGTKLLAPSGDYGTAVGTLAFDINTSTGYYWEVTFNASSGTEIGVIENNKRPTASNAGDAGASILQARGGGGGNTWWIDQDDSSVDDTGVSHADGHRIGVAVKEGKIWFAYNNTYFFSGNPSTGANPAFTGLGARGLHRAFFRTYNSGIMYSHMNENDWSYSPPTGFKALQQDNLVTSTKEISDLVWTKNRDSSDAHTVLDSFRGGSARLETDDAGAEATVTNMINKFLAGGQQIGSYADMNRSGDSFVSWNWHANGGTSSANTDGSGATIASTIQANDTAGFSMVTYTGTGSNGKVAHGLSAAPHWVVVKNRGESEGWTNYHIGMDSATKIMTWNNTNSQADSAGDWNSTAPTSTIVNVGTNARTNKNTINYIMYCWRPVKGYSKFGKYEGNNSASNGIFIHTGFKPSWLMVKSLDENYGWKIFDNKRSPTNPVDNSIDADAKGTENTSTYIVDFCANGIKMRDSNSNTNAAVTYIYMAFAEHPFIGNGTNPATAY